jgi:flagellar biosynthetic protein FlhB
MSEASERTQTATPRRRQQARDEGRVAQSYDLGSAALVLGSLAALVLIGAKLLEFLIGLLRAQLGGAGWKSWTDNPAHPELVASQWQGLASPLAKLLLPLLAGATLLCLAVHLLQTGFLFRPAAVLPDWSRVAPRRGLSRLASPDGALNVALGLVKIAVLAAVALANLWHQRQELAALAALDVPTAAGRAWEICLSLALQVGLVMLGLAVVDYLLKRSRLERELRMTPQELREEMRELQGDPQLAARRRKSVLAKPSGSGPHAAQPRPLHVGPIDSLP